MNEVRDFTYVMSKEAYSFLLKELGSDKAVLSYVNNSCRFLRKVTRIITEREMA